MKKIILVSLLIIFIFSCGSNENVIIETPITKDKIEFPFEELDDGQFITIIRNNHFDSVSISLIMLSGTIIPDSQSLDFCEGVDAVRNGKIIMEWQPINLNYSMVPEINIENQNDHPNLISYNLPVGTYLFMLMDADSCNRDNHVVFDVKRNKYIEGLK